MNSWNIQEITYLYDNASSLTCTEMSQYLKRTPNAIHCKAKSLKIKLKKGPCWTNENTNWRPSDENYLRQNASQKSLIEISKILKRSPKSLTEKCQEMGVETWQAPNLNHWNAEDLAQLLKFKERGLSASAISKYFNRSPWAIYKKLRSLGLVTPKNEQKAWTSEEISKLKLLKLTHSISQVSKILQRSETSIRAKLRRLKVSAKTENIGLKELTFIFSEENFSGNISDIFRYWVSRGLTLTSKDSRNETTVYLLRNFFKRCPDVLDVYSLNPATLEELELDLDNWPEPPNFKILSCSGYHPGKKKQMHPPVSSVFGLYDKSCVCPYCHMSLKISEVVSYTNEWQDPAPFPYVLKFCNGKRARPDKRHAPLRQICKGDEDITNCRICNRKILNSEKVFFMKKPSLSETLFFWEKIALKHFKILTLDFLRYKGNLYWVKI